MNQKDLKRFAELIAWLAETFRQAATPALIAGYREALLDLSIEEIEKAVRRALKTSTYMPYPKELRDLAGVQSPQQRAVIAFEAVAGATKSIGPGPSVDFDDPICNAAIRNLGGWERICEINDREEFEKWFRKEYERVYVLLASQERIARERCLPLLGEYARHNGAHGHKVEPPRKVAVGLPAAPNWPKLDAPEPVRPAVKLLPGLEDFGSIGGK